MGHIAGQHMPPWAVNPRVITVDNVSLRARQMITEPIENYDRSEVAPMLRELYTMIQVLTEESQRQGEKIKELLPDLA